MGLYLKKRRYLLIGGQRWRYWGWQRYKSEAERQAEGLRDRGYNVRILARTSSHGDKGFGMYIRVKAK